MVEHFKALLGAVVSDPQRRVSALPLTDERLRGRLIEGFNDDPEELEEAGAAAESHV